MMIVLVHARLATQLIPIAPPAVMPTHALNVMKPTEILQLSVPAARVAMVVMTAVFSVLLSIPIAPPVVMPTRALNVSLVIMLMVLMAVWKMRHHAQTDNGWTVVCAKSVLAH